MSLRGAHELGVALASSLALLSVLLGGELPAALWVAVAVPWLSMALRLKQLEISPFVGTAVALGGFAWAAAKLLQRGMDGSMLSAAIALVGIVVGRQLTRRTPEHDLQALVLSLLLVFAGTVLHQQVTYGVAFTFYAVAVTWALITRQLVAGAEIEAQRQSGASLRNIMLRRDVVTPTFFAVTAVVALLILVASSVLFILFPRIGMGSLALRGRNSAHLPGDVSLLGSARAGEGGNQVVARLRGVSYRQFLRGLYLRGSVYDRLTTTGFSRSGDLLDVRAHKLNLAPAVDNSSYEIFLEPVTDQLLLTLGPTRRFRVLSGGFANPSGRARILGVQPADELMSYLPLTGPIRYEIVGGIEAARMATPSRGLNTQVDDPNAWNDPAFARHFLQMPAHLDGRVIPLAQRIVGPARSFDARAASLRRYLLANFGYTLSQPNANKADPLAAFLFEDRRGHCEYFATAFALLLRAVGVPSRVVGGFAGGSWDEAAELAVFTGNNAHAWVEWYEPKRGWIVDDATPPDEGATLTGMSAWVERVRRAWDDQVVQFGLEQQLDLFSSLTSSFRAPQVPGEQLPWRPVALSVLAVCSAALVFWSWRRGWGWKLQRAAPLTRTFIEALERLLGEPIAGGMTLREAVRRTTSMAPLAPHHSALLWQALACYEQVRFGRAGSVHVPRQLLVGLRRLPRGVSTSRGRLS